MKTLELRNGAVEAEELIRTAMISIGALDMLQFYDLVTRCRDSEYQMFSATERRLKELSLLQSDGWPHDSIRNVALSTAEGEGLEMVRVSPIKPEGD